MFIYSIFLWPLLYFLLSNDREFTKGKFKGWPLGTAVLAAIPLLLLTGWIGGVLPVLWNPAYLLLKDFILKFFLVYLFLIPSMYLIMRKNTSDRVKEQILRFSVSVFFIKSIFFAIAANSDWGLLEYLFHPTVDAGTFTVIFLCYSGKIKISKYLKPVFPLVQLFLGISAGILLIHRLFVFSWILFVLNISFAVVLFVFSGEKQPEN